MFKSRQEWSKLSLHVTYFPCKPWKFPSLLRFLRLKRKQTVKLSKKKKKKVDGAESNLAGQCFANLQLQTNLNFQFKKKPTTLNVDVNNAHLVAGVLVSGRKPRAQTNPECRPEQQQHLKSPRQLLSHLLDLPLKAGVEMSLDAFERKRRRKKISLNS